MATTPTDKIMDLILPSLALMDKSDLEEASERINNTIDVLMMKSV